MIYLAIYMLCGVVAFFLGARWLSRQPLPNYPRTDLFDQNDRVVWVWGGAIVWPLTVLFLSGFWFFRTVHYSTGRIVEIMRPKPLPDPPEGKAEDRYR